MTTADLLHNLIVSIALLCSSVFIQAGFTLLVLALLPRLSGWSQARHHYLAQGFAMTCLLLILIINHLTQIHIWALAFYLLSYFPKFWNAQYFAAQTYTTLGYGDLLLPPERSTLAGWLALTGLLMIGWSTALCAYLITKYFNGHASLGDREGS